MGGGDIGFGTIKKKGGGGGLLITAFMGGKDDCLKIPIF